MDDRLTYTPKEAAHMLGVSMAFIYKEMARGKIGSLRFGTRRLIHKDQLASYVTACTVGQHTPVDRPVDEAHRRRMRKPR